MIYVNSNQLQPGMIVAENINLYTGDNFNSILLTKGQVLNRSYIKRIIDYNILGVYIKNEHFDDISVEPLINEVLKTQSLTSIKKIFSHTNLGVGNLEKSEVDEISTIVDNLTNEVVSKKDLINNMAEFRSYDNYTYQHCLNVSLLSILTGISYGLSDKNLHNLGMSGMLHDIGKLVVPIQIINKPDKLTKAEFEIMKEHPVNGVKQVENFVSEDILSGIEMHHENMDGTGYPYGKKSDEISLFGKIISVCDVYDALTSQRSYRKPCIPSEAIEFLMGNAYTKFDYKVLSCFLKNLVAYPVGTLVKLSNDKVAVVIKNYSDNIMRPLVRIINDDYSAGETIDLLNDTKYMNVTILSGNI